MTAQGTPQLVQCVQLPLDKNTMCVINYSEGGQVLDKVNGSILAEENSAISVGSAINATSVTEIADLPEKICPEEHVLRFDFNVPDESGLESYESAMKSFGVKIRERPCDLFCGLCGSIMSTIRDWVMHHFEQDHRKIVSAICHFRERCIEHVSDDENESSFENEASLLKDKLKYSQELFVVGNRAICAVCLVEVDTNNIWSHVGSMDHNIAYMNVLYPKAFISIKMASVIKNQIELKVLEEMSVSFLASSLPLTDSALEMIALSREPSFVRWLFSCISEVQALRDKRYKDDSSIQVLDEITSLQMSPLKSSASVNARSSVARAETQKELKAASELAGGGDIESRKRNSSPRSRTSTRRTEQRNARSASKHSHHSSSSASGHNRDHDRILMHQSNSREGASLKDKQRRDGSKKRSHCSPKREYIQGPKNSRHSHGSKNEKSRNRRHGQEEKGKNSAETEVRREKQKPGSSLSGKDKHEEKRVEELLKVVAESREQQLKQQAQMDYLLTLLHTQTALAPPMAPPVPALVEPVPEMVPHPSSSTTAPDFADYPFSYAIVGQGVDGYMMNQSQYAAPQEGLGYYGESSTNDGDCMTTYELQSGYGLYNPESYGGESTSGYNLWPSVLQSDLGLPDQFGAPPKKQKTKSKMQPKAKHNEKRSVTSKSSVRNQPKEVKKKPKQANAGQFSTKDVPLKVYGPVVPQAWFEAVLTDAKSADEFYVQRKDQLWRLGELRAEMDRFYNSADVQSIHLCADDMIQDFHYVLYDIREKCWRRVQLVKMAYTWPGEMDCVRQQSITFTFQCLDSGYEISFVDELHAVKPLHSKFLWNQSCYFMCLIDPVEFWRKPTDMENETFLDFCRRNVNQLLALFPQNRDFRKPVRGRFPVTQFGAGVIEDYESFRIGDGEFNYRLLLAEQKHFAENDPIILQELQRRGEHLNSLYESHPAKRPRKSGYYCQLCEVFCGTDQKTIDAHHAGKFHYKNLKKMSLNAAATTATDFAWC